MNKFVLEVEQQEFKYDLLCNKIEDNLLICAFSADALDEMMVEWINSYKNYLTGKNKPITFYAHLDLDYYLVSFKHALRIERVEFDDEITTITFKIDAVN